jgi:hypothetical protein
LTWSAGVVHSRWRPNRVVAEAYRCGEGLVCWIGEFRRVLFPIAAAAVFKQFNLPRRVLSLSQGESLLNDAVALLIAESPSRLRGGTPADKHARDLSGSRFCFDRRTGE